MLKTPYQDHALLQSHISRLAIALEAHAISSPSVTITSPTNETRRPASNAVPNRDVIWSDKLDVTQDPIIIVAGSDDTEDGQDVLLIWRLGAFLSTKATLDFGIILTVVDRPAKDQTTGSSSHL